MASADDLLADLPIPASALKVFGECGVDTTALICWTKDQIFEALSQVDVDWKVDVVWEWISSWRSRNGLENAVIVYQCNSKVPEDEEQEAQNAYDIPAVKIELVDENKEDKQNDETTHSESEPEDSIITQETTLGTVPTPGDEVIPETEPETKSEDAEIAQDISAPVDEPHSNYYFSPNVLKGLLQKTAIGPKILENANKVKLSDASQKFVTDIVAKQHLDRDKKVTARQLEIYADVIIKVFPKEKKATYFISQEKGNPLGKLYSRVNYLRQSERNREKKEEKHLSGALEAKSSKIEIPHQAITALEWLQLNHSPWSTVISQWELSFEARKENLRKHNQSSKVLQTFPHLFAEYGYQLVDIDYRLLGLKTSCGGLNKWEEIIDPIGLYIGKNAKDPSAKLIAQTIQNTKLSTDLRLPALLLGLNTVLIPVKAASGFKPTITTAQEDTILFCKTIEDVPVALDKLQALWEEQGTPATAKLVILGENYRNFAGNCLVVYKDLRYNLPNIARGIDVLIKLTVVLGLPISKISKLVWLFVQKYVYEIDIANTYVCIAKLSEYLTANQPCSSNAASKNV